MTSGPDANSAEDPFNLDTAAEAINYRNWMMRRFEPYIGQRILDVGAGIGTFTEVLLDREFVLPLEPYEPFLQVLTRRFGDRLQASPVGVDLTDPAVRELASYRFDTAICTNVLEHIEDDALALFNLNYVLQPGGRLILFVPAHQFLYGSVDSQLEHYRRYAKKGVRAKFDAAGFVVEELSEMNAIGMVGWFLNGRMQRQKEVPAWQVGLYDRWVAPLAERVERVIPPPVGLSILAVGRKP